MDAIEMLPGRSSAQQLTGPAPTDEELDRIYRSALRAPDHGRLRPWKFLTVRYHMRSKFGDLLAASLKRQRPNVGPDILQRERDKAMRAPLIIVVVHKPQPTAKILAVEQMISGAVAAQNIMQAAHALGYGAMWKTGDAAYDDEVKWGLGLEQTDAIIGFIYIGTRVQPPNAPPERPRPAAKDFVVEWRD